MKAYFKKSISIVVLAFFTVNSCFADVAGLGIEFSSRKETPKLMQIDIPAELASVEEFWEAPPRPNPKMILQIQNAHTNYEAQNKIRDLMSYLNQNYGFKTIFVEGASEKLNPEYLSLFSDKETNRKLWDELAKRGQITGADWFLLENPEKAQGVGIEKAELYRENYEALKSVYEKSDLTERFLTGLDLELDKQATQVLDSNTRKVISEWKKFEKGHREFIPFVEDLAEIAQRSLGLDLRSLYSQIEWPQMTRILVLHEMERKLEVAGVRDQAEAERQKMLLWLRDHQISQELIEGLERLNEANINMNRIRATSEKMESLPRFFVEKLLEEAGPKGLRFSEYPNFTLYTGYLILRYEVEPNALFDEIRRLFEKILNQSSVDNQSASRMIELFRDAELLRKLFNLELSRGEWGRVLARKAELDPQVLFARVMEKDIKSSDSHLNDYQKQVIAVFDSAFDFYDLAVRRDEVFYQKMAKELERTDRAILMTGGFHTEGLREIFREKEISYGTLTPRLTQVEKSNLYRDVMLGKSATSFHAATVEIKTMLGRVGGIDWSNSTDIEILTAQMSELLDSIFSVSEREKRKAAVQSVRDYFKDAKGQVLIDEEAQTVKVVQGKGSLEIGKVRSESRVVDDAALKSKADQLKVYLADRTKDGEKIEPKSKARFIFEILGTVFGWVVAVYGWAFGVEIYDHAIMISSLQEFLLSPLTQTYFATAVISSISFIVIRKFIADYQETNFDAQAFTEKVNSDLPGFLSLTASLDALKLLALYHINYGAKQYRELLEKMNRLGAKTKNAADLFHFALLEISGEAAGFSAQAEAWQNAMNAQNKRKVKKVLNRFFKRHPAGALEFFTGTGQRKFNLLMQHVGVKVDSASPVSFYETNDAGKQSSLPFVLGGEIHFSVSDQAGNQYKIPLINARFSQFLQIGSVVSRSEAREDTPTDNPFSDLDPNVIKNIMAIAMTGIGPDLDYYYAKRARYIFARRMAEKLAVPEEDRILFERSLEETDADDLEDLERNLRENKIQIPSYISRADLQAELTGLNKSAEFVLETIESGELDLEDLNSLRLFFETLNAPDQERFTDQELDYIVFPPRSFQSQEAEKDSSEQAFVVPELLGVLGVVGVGLILPGLFMIAPLYTFVTVLGVAFLAAVSAGREYRKGLNGSRSDGEQTLGEQVTERLNGILGNILRKVFGIENKFAINGVEPIRPNLHTAGAAWDDSQRLVWAATKFSGAVGLAADGVRHLPKMNVFRSEARDSLGISRRDVLKKSGLVGLGLLLTSLEQTFGSGTQEIPDSVRVNLDKWLSQPKYQNMNMDKLKDLAVEMEAQLQQEAKDAGEEFVAYNLNRADRNISEILSSVFSGGLLTDDQIAGLKDLGLAIHLIESGQFKYLMQRKWKDGKPEKLIFVAVGNAQAEAGPYSSKTAQDMVRRIENQKNVSVRQKMLLNLRDELAKQLGIHPEDLIYLRAYLTEKYGDKANDILGLILAHEIISNRKVDALFFVMILLTSLAYDQTGSDTEAVANQKFITRANNITNASIEQQAAAYGTFYRKKPGQDENNLKKMEQAVAVVAAHQRPARPEKQAVVAIVDVPDEKAVSVARDSAAIDRPAVDKPALSVPKIDIFELPAEERPEGSAEIFSQMLTDLTVTTTPQEVSSVETTVGLSPSENPMVMLWANSNADQLDWLNAGFKESLTDNTFFIKAGASAALLAWLAGFLSRSGQHRTPLQVAKDFFKAPVQTFFRNILYFSMAMELVFVIVLVLNVYFVSWGIPFFTILWIKQGTIVGAFPLMGYLLFRKYTSAKKTKRLMQALGLKPLKIQNKSTSGRNLQIPLKGYHVVIFANDRDPALERETIKELRGILTRKVDMPRLMSVVALNAKHASSIQASLTDRKGNERAIVYDGTDEDGIKGLVRDASRLPKSERLPEIDVVLFTERGRHTLKYLSDRALIAYQKNRRAELREVKFSAQSRISSLTGLKTYFTVDDAESLLYRPDEDGELSAEILDQIFPALESLKKKVIPGSDDKLRVLEIGTGTGLMALAMAKYLVETLGYKPGQIEFDSVDIDARAREVAFANQEKIADEELRVVNFKTVEAGREFQGAESKYNLIFGNLPDVVSRGSTYAGKSQIDRNSFQNLMTATADHLARDGLVLVSNHYQALSSFPEGQGWSFASNQSGTSLLEMNGGNHRLYTINNRSEMRDDEKGWDGYRELKDDEVVYVQDIPILKDEVSERVQRGEVLEQADGTLQVSDDYRMRFWYHGVTGDYTERVKSMLFGSDRLGGRKRNPGFLDAGNTTQLIETAEAWSHKGGTSLKRDGEYVYEGIVLAFSFPDIKTTQRYAMPNSDVSSLKPQLFRGGRRVSVMSGNIDRPIPLSYLARSTKLEIIRRFQNNEYQNQDDPAALRQLAKSLGLSVEDIENENIPLDIRSEMRRLQNVNQVTAELKKYNGTIFYPLAFTDIENVIALASLAPQAQFILNDAFIFGQSSGDNLPPTFEVGDKRSDISDEIREFLKSEFEEKLGFNAKVSVTFEDDDLGDLTIERVNRETGEVVFLGEQQHLFNFSIEIKPKKGKKINIRYSVGRVQMMPQGQNQVMFIQAPGWGGDFLENEENVQMLADRVADNGILMVGYSKKFPLIEKHFRPIGTTQLRGGSMAQVFQKRSEMRDGFNEDEIHGKFLDIHTLNSEQALSEGVAQDKDAWRTFWGRWIYGLSAAYTAEQDGLDSIHQKTDFYLAPQNQAGTLADKQQVADWINTKVRAFAPNAVPLQPEQIVILKPSLRDSSSPHGLALRSVGKIIFWEDQLIPEKRALFEWTMVHESLHLVFPNLLGESLNEAVTEYLTGKILNREPYNDGFEHDLESAFAEISGQQAPERDGPTSGYYGWFQALKALFDLFPGLEAAVLEAYRTGNYAQLQAASSQLSDGRLPKDFLFYVLINLEKFEKNGKLLEIFLFSETVQLMLTYRHRLMQLRNDVFLNRDQIDEDELDALNRVDGVIHKIDEAFFGQGDVKGILNGRFATERYSGSPYQSLSHERNFRLLSERFDIERFKAVPRSEMRYEVDTASFIAGGVPGEKTREMMSVLRSPQFQDIENVKSYFRELGYDELEVNLNGSARIFNGYDGTSKYGFRIDFGRTSGRSLSLMFKLERSEGTISHDETDDLKKIDSKYVPIILAEGQTANGLHWMAEEFIDGIQFSEVLEESELTLEEYAAYLITVLGVGKDLNFEPPSDLRHQNFIWQKSQARMVLIDLGGTRFDLENSVKHRLYFLYTLWATAGENGLNETVQVAADLFDDLWGDQARLLTKRVIEDFTAVRQSAGSSDPTYEDNSFFEWVSELNADLQARSETRSLAAEAFIAAVENLSGKKISEFSPVQVELEKGKPETFSIEDAFAKLEAIAASWSDEESYGIQVVSNESELSIGLTLGDKLLPQETSVTFNPDYEDLIVAIGDAVRQNTSKDKDVSVIALESPRNESGQLKNQNDFDDPRIVEIAFSEVIEVKGPQKEKLPEPKFADDSLTTAIPGLSVIRRQGHRSSHQDRDSAFEIDTPLGKAVVLAVFDGHGNDGSAVADLANQIVSADIRDLLEELNSFDGIEEKIKSLFSQAHEGLRSLELDGGSTVSVAVLLDQKLISITLGDSPVYLIEQSSPGVLFESFLDHTGNPKAIAQADERMDLDAIDKLTGFGFDAAEKAYQFRGKSLSGFRVLSSLGDYAAEGMGREPRIEIIDLSRTGNYRLIVGSDGILNPRHTDDENKQRIAQAVRDQSNNPLPEILRLSGDGSVSYDNFTVYSLDLAAYQEARSEARTVPAALWLREKAPWKNGLAEESDAEDFTFNRQEALQVKDRAESLRRLITIAEEGNNQELLRLLNYPSFVLFWLGLKPAYISTQKGDFSEPEVTALESFSQELITQGIALSGKLSAYRPIQVANRLMGIQFYLYEKQVLTEEESKLIGQLASVPFSERNDAYSKLDFSTLLLRTNYLSERANQRRIDLMYGVFLGVPLDEVRGFDRFVYENSQDDLISIKVEKIRGVDVGDISFGAARDASKKISRETNKHVARYYDALDYFYSRSEARDFEDEWMASVSSKDKKEYEGFVEWYEGNQLAGAELNPQDAPSIRLIRLPSKRDDGGMAFAVWQKSAEGLWQRIDNENPNQGFQFAELKTSKLMHLRQIYLKDQARGQGVGGALLNWMRSRFDRFEMDQFQFVTSNLDLLTAVTHRWELEEFRFVATDEDGRTIDFQDALKDLNERVTFSAIKKVPQSDLVTARSETRNVDWDLVKPIEGLPWNNQIYRENVQHIYVSGEYDFGNDAKLGYDAVRFAWMIPALLKRFPKATIEIQGVHFARMFDHHKERGRIKAVTVPTGEYQLAITQHSLLGKPAGLNADYFLDIVNLATYGAARSELLDRSGNAILKKEIFKTQERPIFWNESEAILKEWGLIEGGGEASLNVYDHPEVGGHQVDWARLVRTADESDFFDRKISGKPVPAVLKQIMNYQTMNEIVTGKSNVVYVNLDAVTQEQTFNKAFWVQLLSKVLHANPNSHLMFSGGTSQSARSFAMSVAEELIAYSSGNQRIFVLPVIAPQYLSQVWDFMAIADAVVTPNTGFMHMAHAAGRPLFVVDTSKEFTQHWSSPSEKTEMLYLLDIDRIFTHHAALAEQYVANLFQKTIALKEKHPRQRLQIGFEFTRFAPQFSRMLDSMRQAAESVEISSVERSWIDHHNRLLESKSAIEAGYEDFQVYLQTYVQAITQGQDESQIVVGTYDAQAVNKLIAEIERQEKTLESETAGKLFLSYMIWHLQQVDAENGIAFLKPIVSVKDPQRSEVRLGDVADTLKRFEVNPSISASILVAVIAGGFVAPLSTLVTTGVVTAALAVISAVIAAGKPQGMFNEDILRRAGWFGTDNSMTIELITRERLSRMVPDDIRAVLNANENSRYGFLIVDPKDNSELEAWRNLSDEFGDRFRVETLKSNITGNLSSLSRGVGLGLIQITGEEALLAQFKSEITQGFSVGRDLRWISFSGADVAKYEGVRVAQTVVAGQAEDITQLPQSDVRVFERDANDGNHWNIIPGRLGQLANLVLEIQAAAKAAVSA